MAETVPQAATVRTLRWGLAVAIRFWCLIHLAAVVLEASEAWHGAAMIGWVSPSGAIAPRWDAALVEAGFGLITPILASTALFLAAPRIALAAVPGSAGSRIPDPCRPWYERARAAAPWWCAVALRGWGLLLLARLSPVADQVRTEAARTAAYLFVRGDAPDAGGTSPLGRFWHNTGLTLLDQWPTLAVALVLWFTARSLARLINRVPAPACPSCGYPAAGHACPECGAELTPAAPPPPPRQ